MTTTLQSIASTTSKLRALLADTKKDLERIRSLQKTLTETLSGFLGASSTNEDVDNEARSPAAILARDERLWKETVTILATGRVLGIAAQAEDALASKGNDVRERSWIADGKRYVTWLAKGIAKITVEHDQLSAAQQMLGKSLRIGYQDELMQTLTNELVLERREIDVYCQLIRDLTAWEQRKILSSLLTYLGNILNKAIKQGSSRSVTNDNDYRSCIGGVAALLKELSKDNVTIQDELVNYLLSQQPSIGILRACAISLDADHLYAIMENSWQKFSDKLSIKHQPIIQQEATARLLLLVVGIMHRSKPMEILVFARSSIHTNGISSRLGSSSTRVRWLGMVVGMAVSSLVDKKDNKMNFDVPDMKTDEAAWYQSLVLVDDCVSDVADLVKSQKPHHSANISSVPPQKPAMHMKDARTKSKSTNPQPKIVEIASSDEEEDDLTPYAKPDSDASDSEEDATLVQRSKEKTPVYILDLIAGLSDNENYDRHVLALKTASGLISRKADFGSELEDRAEELASVIVVMQDTFELDDFPELRQSAMIALVAAKPRIIGPWCAKMFFAGDYSIAQRALILTSIGLGCRELAGLKNESNAILLRQQNQDLLHKPFPSKKLPPHLHKLYGGQAETVNGNQIDAVTRQLEQTMLRPVATKERRRTKVLHNNLASIVADSFFFPLSGTWQSFASFQQTAIGSKRGSSTSLTDPTLLSLFVKTLVIILSAAGNATLALPQMTTELWSLLLSFRSRALTNPPLLEAVLFGFLTILEINEQRRIAERDATLLLETREWVGTVWEKLEGEGGLRGLSQGTGDEVGVGVGALNDPDSKEVERAKYLAAGILVRIKEVVDEYQRLMAGELVRF